MAADPVLWNSLPLSERQARNIDAFKRLVKTYLSSMAFCGDFKLISFKFMIRC